MDRSHCDIRRRPLPGSGREHQVLRHPQVLESFAQLGYPAASGPIIGTIGLLCAALYAAPRTALLGTVLLTGLCGGAVASHFRIGSPLLTHVLFGVYVGVLAWVGLWCREARLRALMPLRHQASEAAAH
jgi:hypothetical protein